MSTLRESFAEAVWQAVRESKVIGCPSPRFEDMINSNHPVEVAKQLVLSGDLQTGFRKIVDMGRSDLTVESIMLRPEYNELFNQKYIKAAQWRLDNV